MRVGSISHMGTAWQVVLVAWGAVIAALISQHVAGFEPCPWCIVQRVTYLLVGLFALPAALLEKRSRPASLGPRGSGTGPAGLIRRLLLALAGLAAIGGLAAALHQQFVAAQTSSCAFTAADRWISRSGLDEALPALFRATAACDQANEPMLGLPYAVWSMLVAVLLLVLIVLAWRRDRGGG